MLSVTQVGPIYCQLPSYLVDISSLASLHGVCSVSQLLRVQANTLATSVGALWLQLPGEISQ